MTVAGLLQDNSPKAADETLTEQARYAAAASGENSVWRSIGVGGVVGTMDAANLKLEADPINKKTITNKAAVIGSAFTGGVVGNLYNSSSTDVTLTGLQNEVRSAWAPTTRVKTAVCWASSSAALRATAKMSR